MQRPLLTASLAATAVALGAVFATLTLAQQGGGCVAGGGWWGCTGPLQPASPMQTQAACNAPQWQSLQGSGGYAPQLESARQSACRGDMPTAQTSLTQALPALLGNSADAQQVAALADQVNTLFSLLAIHGQQARP